MEFEFVEDAVEFRDRTERLLVDEARHNLLRGILGVLISQPDTYPDRRMMLVTEDGEPAACALMTIPYNLIIADPRTDIALRRLLTEVARSDLDVPGLIGNQPHIAMAARSWQELTGDTAELTMSQAIYSLSGVLPPRPAAGAARLAGESDLDLVVDWHSAFITEALPDEPHDEARLRKSLQRRLTEGGRGQIWLWVNDGEVVSMSANTSPTGTGIRINAVYTPPQHRGNGYASSLVATQSQHLLDSGYDFCFLFTDLANPTSNKIYESIGYRRVAEAASYRLRR